MAYQEVDNGTTAGDGTGELLFDALDKVNANFEELYGQLGAGVISSTVTTKQNDYAPTGWAACRVLRWNGAGSTGITGFDATGIADGAEKTIVNGSTDYLLWLENQNTASAAASRMLLPDSFPAFLMPGDSITLLYDATAARWRVKEWPTRGQAMGLSECQHFALSEAAFKLLPSGSGATASHSSGFSSGYPINAIGGIALKTGTTATGYSVCTFNASGCFRPDEIGSALLVSRCAFGDAVDGTETYTGYIGFADINAGVFNDGAAWEYRWNGAAAVLDMTRAAGGAYTRSTQAGITVTTPLWLGVFLNTNMTRADYIYSTDNVNFLLAGEQTTGLPTGTQQSSLAVGIVKSAGTTQRYMTIDILGFRIVQ